MFYIPKEKPLLILSVLLGMAFLVFGGMKFASPPQLVENFANWGYPSGFHYLVGLAEAGCAVGLFIRPVARFAALGLVVLMIGAFATHALHPPLSAGVPSLALGLLAAATAYLHFAGKSR